MHQHDLDANDFAEIRSRVDHVLNSEVMRDPHNPGYYMVPQEIMSLFHHLITHDLLLLLAMVDHPN